MVTKQQLYKDNNYYRSIARSYSSKAIPNARRDNECKILNYWILTSSQHCVHPSHTYRQLA